MKGLVISAFVISLVSIGLSAATYIQVGGVAQIKSRMEDLGLEIRDLREETARKLELRALLFEALQTLSHAGDLISWGEDYGEAASGVRSTEAILKEAESMARGTERTRIEEIRQAIGDVTSRVESRERTSANELRRLVIKLRLLRDNL